MSFSDVSLKDNVEAFLAEIEMVKRVSEGNNSHVVKMVGCVTMSIPLALILEYVPQGNLQDYLRTTKTNVGISTSIIVTVVNANFNYKLLYFFPSLDSSSIVFLR